MFISLFIVEDSTYLICKSLLQDKISQLESEAFQTPNMLG